MSDLNPEDRALLDEAREAHEPTARDRARVRLALLLQLGVGTGLAGTTAATSKAATLVAFTKVLAAIAVAGAIGGASVVAHRATKSEPTPAAAAPGVGISERGAVKAAPAQATNSATALREPRSPEPTQEGFERNLPGGSRSASRIGVPATPRAAPPGVPASPAAAPDVPGPPLPETAVAPVASRSTLNAPPALASVLPPTTLEAETRLIRAGLTALHGGDAARALALFDEHHQAFPNGALAEERAAERVIALGDLRRCEEARASAAAFLREYPHSPLAARVREPCSGSPNP